MKFSQTSRGLIRERIAARSGAPSESKTERIARQILGRIWKRSWISPETFLGMFCKPAPDWRRNHFRINFVSDLQWNFQCFSNFKYHVWNAF